MGHIDLLTLAWMRHFLREFSSEELQTRWWLAKSGEISSFIETTCGLFDDAGVGPLIDGGNAGELLGEELRGELVELRSAVHALNESQSPENLIKCQEMEMVRRLAQSALHHLELRFPEELKDAPSVDDL